MVVNGIPREYKTVVTAWIKRRFGPFGSKYEPF